VPNWSEGDVVMVRPGSSTASRVSATTKSTIRSSGRSSSSLGFPERDAGPGQGGGGVRPRDPDHAEPPPRRAPR
jgi:hypothetical protein